MIARNTNIENYQRHAQTFHKEVLDVNGNIFAAETILSLAHMLVSYKRTRIL